MSGISPVGGGPPPQDPDQLNQVQNPKPISSVNVVEKDQALGFVQGSQMPTGLVTSTFPPPERAH